MHKRIVCPDRIRFLPKQFSWIDQTLVRKKYICNLSHSSLALYLFLLTVSDADGISYYSDAAIERYLHFKSTPLHILRRELCDAGFIAYSKPFYQVLSLQYSSDTLPQGICETTQSKTNVVRTNNKDAIPIGQIMTSLFGGAQ